MDPHGLATKHIDGGREPREIGSSGLFCADRRTEAIFCLALLPEGTEAVERITMRFLQYRDNMTPELLALIDGTHNAESENLT